MAPGENREALITVSYRSELGGFYRQQYRLQVRKADDGKFSSHVPVGYGSNDPHPISLGTTQRWWFRLTVYVCDRMTSKGTSAEGAIEVSVKKCGSSWSCRTSWPRMKRS